MIGKYMSSLHSSMTKIYPHLFILISGILYPKYPSFISKVILYFPFFCMILSGLYLNSPSLSSFSLHSFGTSHSLALEWNMICEVHPSSPMADISI